MYDWYKKWKIKINTNKSQSVMYTKQFSQPQQNLTINNISINWTNNVKYLGIIIDRKLT